MEYTTCFIISLFIFCIAFFVITIIVVQYENEKDEYKMFASFGGTPNISQIRRPWGRVAMGPDYC